MKLIKDDDIIGKRIKDLRTEKRLTQSELAKYLNIARSTLAGYETGKISPSMDVLIRISEFFGVSINYLIATGEVVDDTLDVFTELKELLDKIGYYKYIVYHKNQLEVLEREFLQLKLKNTVDELNLLLR